MRSHTEIVDMGGGGECGLIYDASCYKYAMGKCK